MAATGRIFISYRRNEADYPASWLYQRLGRHFGVDRIFKDVDSIELGDDFVEAINRAVGSCDVLLVLIGDRWLTIGDDKGRRRLDDPGDLVRLEIEAALARDVRVIPILVGRAPMPLAEDLPASMAGLARRQALELSPTRFKSDFEKLLRALHKTLEEERVRRAAARPPDPLPEDPRRAPARTVTATAPAQRWAVPETTGLEPVPAAGTTGARPAVPSVRGWRPGPRALKGLAALLGAVAVVVGVVLAIGGDARAEVPDLTRLDRQTATAQLERLGLRAGIRDRPDPAPKDTVLETVPPAGRRVDPGAVVILYVSSGPAQERIAVPSVRGKDRDEAVRLLRDAGFEVKETAVPGGEEAAGIAVGTDPPAGRRLPPGTTVELKVSSGAPGVQVRVPDVVGQVAATAEATLRDLGLEPVRQEEWSELPIGHVAGSRPAAGELVARGSSVVLLVSKGPPTKTTPTTNTTTPTTPTTFPPPQTTASPTP
jgi:beta-lactam-binding protein with PASTA domain